MDEWPSGTLPFRYVQSAKWRQRRGSDWRWDPGDHEMDEIQGLGPGAANVRSFHPKFRFSSP